MEFTSMITKFFSGLLAGLVVSSPVYAINVDDCIDVYEDYKQLFGKSVSKIQFECTRADNSINYYATAVPPFSCIDEDEWYFDVRAVAGKGGKCSAQVIGTIGPECRAEKVEYALDKENADKWMQFVDGECAK
jgi:hypothetical protein